MRGRGVTSNEAANLLKRESRFKFHIFNQRTTLSVGGQSRKSR